MSDEFGPTIVPPTQLPGYDSSTRVDRPSMAPFGETQSSAGDRNIVLKIVKPLQIDEDVRLFLGDAKTRLAELTPNSIQCFVTSPPYYRCRNYPNSSQLGQEESPSEYIRNLCAVFDQAKNPLKDDGLLWVVIGDSKAKKNYNDIGCSKGEFFGIPWLFAFEMRRRGWRIQQENIWAKKNPIPTSSNRMLTPSHESVFMFSQSDDYRFDPRKVVVESKSTVAGSSMPPIGGLKLGGGDNSSYSGNRPSATGMARRRDVFFLATSKLPEAHFAPYPGDLIEPLIIASTEPGDVVGDMFCGSGTTGIISKKNSRRFVGIEYSPDYLKLSTERITGSDIGTQNVSGETRQLVIKVVS